MKFLCCLPTLQRSHNIETHQLQNTTKICDCQQMCYGNFPNQNSILCPCEGRKNEKYQCISEDFEDATQNPDASTNNNVNYIVKFITMRCKSLGNTSKAAQDERSVQFEMMDHFGLTSLLLTITPDDECRFRVRLHADPVV